MAEKKNLTPARIFGYAVLMFIVGIAGVLAGTLLRDHFASPKSAMVSTRVPRSLLKQGMIFPDAPVVTTDGRMRRTVELIDHSGSVVLFLDLECSPCIKMALRWQDALDNALVEDGKVWAISYHSSEVIQNFMVENDLRFPIYTDSSQTFLKKFEVTRFPLEVVVGASGRIRSLSYDSETPIDFAHLAELLSD